MSGETEGDVSGWTVDTLHAHLQTRIDDLIRQLDERRDTQDRAVRTALTSVDRRLEGMNEFRSTLSDQSKEFLTRAEYDAAHAAVVDRVGDLASRLDRSEGRGVGLNAGWLYLLGGVAAFGTVISLILAFGR